MKIALIGNQNSGKSTLFNALTGSNQKIGNWPGVTVEKKVGVIKGTNHEIVDLPGIYSLSPYTTEERVSRDFLLNENPDLIINIIDATSLERSLYLTTQLLELDYPIIIALNMCDLLEKKGLTINEKTLSDSLGIEVQKISALKKQNLNNLIELINNGKHERKNIQIYSKNVEALIKKVSGEITTNNKRFLAVKIIEKDEEFIKNTNIIKSPSSSKLAQNNAKNKVKLEDNKKEEKSYPFDNDVKKIEKEYDLDIEQIIANERYVYIVDVKKQCVVKKEMGQTITDKLDKIFLNKWLAIPIFVLIMGLVYFLSVGLVGSATVDLIDNGIGLLSDKVFDWLTNLGASAWAVSLVCDGIIAGVGSVLNFVPQLIILFLCIALLETSGYMSRISFFFDKFFRKIGLSGKSLIPFIVGSGCSVPAIMTTRTIENEQEKRTTIMLTPFIPCSAKLPIIALFSGFFFGRFSWLVTLSLYFLAIALIILCAFIIRKFFLKEKDNTFISELPEYKLPNPKYVLKDVFEKTFSFIKRAGTIILLCSIVIWLLVSFDWHFNYLDGENISSSILASIGNCLAWIFYPILGNYSWAATVSAIQGLVAKEQVISSMAVIAGLAEDVTEGAQIFSASGIFSFFTPATAYAFMVFNLFSAPCFGAIGAMRKELGSFKKTIIAVAFQVGVAWLLALITSCIGSLIMLIV